MTSPQSQNVLHPDSMGRGYQVTSTSLPTTKRESFQGLCQAQCCHAALHARHPRLHKPCAMSAEHSTRPCAEWSGYGTYTHR
eukprot:1347616-Pleurochrysis_carterae.AAC.1